MSRCVESKEPKAGLKVVKIKKIKHFLSQMEENWIQTGIMPEEMQGHLNQAQKQRNFQLESNQWSEACQENILATSLWKHTHKRRTNRQKYNNIHCKHW